MPNQNAHHSYTLQPFEPNRDPWEKVRTEIVEIENTAFRKKADDENFLRGVFTDPKNIIILLNDPEIQKTVGYIYAAPDFRTDPKTVAYLESIAFLPSYQGKGLVAPLTDALENELKKRGFQEMTMRAQVNNGYADKVARHYGTRVVETFEQDSKYGMQRYFRITLT